MDLRTLTFLLAAALMPASPAAAQDGDIELIEVEAQPLAAQVRRLAEALDFLGSPLPAETLALIDAARREEDDAETVRAIQRALDPFVLAEVHVNPESRVKVRRGPAEAELVQKGWRAFLVRVHNEAGVTAKLRATSPQARAVYVPSWESGEVDADARRDRWLDLSTYDRAPLAEGLSGLALEYRIVELYSRDVGPREASLAFDVGHGSQDVGFRGEMSVLFDCRPAQRIALEILDEEGRGTMASLLVRDAAGRVYPTPSKRLAPDFFFHPQVYRASGETIELPPGRYDVLCGRGPEYLPIERTVEVATDAQKTWTFELERWIHPRARGWFSGDHHVHAAGCAHYASPTKGVSPEDMRRHQLGEDVNVACVLSWGPCWYYQKQFFEGDIHPSSTADYLMRYDVEVSGFPSQHCGHIVLLRLEEDDYPGTEQIEDWPSWDLPILKWAKEQGGVTGFAHSGWGLEVESSELPNYEMPRFDGIGANEYIVDVTHGAVDFLSTIDTPHVWELNIWYHTLNCGYRPRISGETDFPCIYDWRVGLGRVYCRLDGELDFDDFCDALREGRSYVSDGLSHLMDFTVDGEAPGEEDSELRLAAPGKVDVRVSAAALLPEEPDDNLRSRPYWERPYWHVERARIGDTREVPVEVVVNGRPVARKTLVADGELRELAFEVELERSSWIALRVLPSSHTNPMFVLVGDEPVRASKASARWCLEAVDRCWESKRTGVRDDEREAMRAAYEHARAAYRRILAECRAD